MRGRLAPSLSGPLIETFRGDEKEERRRLFAPRDDKMEEMP